MYRTQALDRGHITDRAKGGTNGPAVLEHASCNRSAGATAGNQAQPHLILGAGHDTTCQACGKPYHYAARSCEICGAHYHPNHAPQRSCSRACGTELRKRNRALGLRAPRQPGAPRWQQRPGAPGPGVTARVSAARAETIMATSRRW